MLLHHLVQLFSFEIEEDSFISDWAAYALEKMSVLQSTKVRKWNEPHPELVIESHDVIILLSYIIDIFSHIKANCKVCA